MAMYHFRLKTDKKPDGTKISAVQHVDYIRREGNYAEEKEWGEKNKFIGNCISTAETKRPPSKRRWVALATESRISAKADKMFQARSSLKFIIGSGSVK